MKARSFSYMLRALGVLFFIIGGISILGVIGHWHFAHEIAWLFVAYSIMNILLGIGFWNRERWLLAAVSINFAAYTLLYAGAWFMGVSVDLTSILASTAVAGGVWVLVYLHRNRLIGSPASNAGIGFLVIWLAAYSYTFAQVF